MHPKACPICKASERKSASGNFDYFECAICQGVYIDSRLVRAPTQYRDYHSFLGAAREMHEKYGWPASIRFDGVVTCPDENSEIHMITEFPTTIAEKAAKLLAVLVNRTTYFGEKISLANSDYGLAYAKSDKEMRAFVDYLQQQGGIDIVSRTMRDITVTVSANVLDGSRDVERSNEGRQMKILFVAANPTTTDHLDLEEELRSLESELRGVKYRNKVICSARHAVRPDDLIRYVREESPNVIHFSGHGASNGIILRNDTGGDTVVSGGALRNFLHGRGVELVVFNSCFSEHQATAIKGAVKTVIGTTGAVGDEAARRFTVAFYRALGSGLSVKEAFRDGRDTVELHGLVDVFHSDGDLDLTLVTS